MTVAWPKLDQLREAPATERVSSIEATKPPPPEPLPRIWARRALTIPATFVVTALFVSLLPIALLIAGAVDLGTRSRFRTSRFLLAVGANLTLHVVGLILLFDAFVRGGRLWGAPPERELRMTARAEAWWADAMVRAAMRIYNMRIVVEGAEALAGKPAIIFMRHSSILDTMLPLALLGRPFGKHIRYVMKRELLLDPCVDVVGHRIPTAFVRRGGQKHGPEIARVMHLAEDLPGDALVVIYPEGTRFSPEKQARVLASLAAKDPGFLARARAYRHVLPPHLGGPLGLLARGEGVDAAFCAHVGLEGAGTLRDFASGALLDRTVRVAFWRVPSSAIPRGEEARKDWLFEQWARVDRWVGEASRGSREASCPRGGRLASPSRAEA